MSVAQVPEGVKILTVSELTRAVKGLMEDAFPSVWVSGEISNLARPASGHIYLTLKDATAQIRAVIWRSIALRLRFDPHDGLDVIARGRITVYPPRGEYQIAVEELHPKGVGAAELALRQLKEKLFRLGYFAPERKRPLPRFPRRVALVTSPTGAAVRDMLEILGRRWPAAEVWVVPVRVQGDGAAEEVADALRRVSRLGAADVVIVGRGGGSAEDLWTFNEACVAEAIFRCAVPVVSAVGHEIDLTVADLVADCRALTPSEAAERITPDRRELAEWLDGLGEQIRGLLRARLDSARDRLNQLADRPAFRAPLERVRDHERRLDEQSARLARAGRDRLERARQRLAAAAARLDALSPLNVLRRGYSVTRSASDLRVVRHADQVRPGDLLVTLVEHGRLYSRVESAQAPGRGPDDLLESS